MLAAAFLGKIPLERLYPGLGIIIIGGPKNPCSSFQNVTTYISPPLHNLHELIFPKLSERGGFRALPSSADPPSSIIDLSGAKIHSDRLPEIIICMTLDTSSGYKVERSHFISIFEARSQRRFLSNLVVLRSRLEGPESR